MSGQDEPVLRVDGLTVGYRSAGLGISNISLEVRRGAVVTLVGPNGAGKSSTLRGVTGFLPREPGRVVDGTVELLGSSVSGMHALALTRRGLAFVPEERKIFAELTVDENLAIGRTIGRSRFAAQREMALEIFPDLQEHLLRRAGVLSGGQRQMLSLASALCLDPRLLVIDEVTLGLSPQLVRSLADSLRRITSLGLPILMAEQNRRLAFDLSTTVHVLAAGRVLGSGTPDELRHRDDLAVAFLGA